MDYPLCQVERISDEVRNEVEDLSPEEILVLALDTAERIEESSSQELALTSALRIAYGYGEIDECESRCITEIAQNWGISLKSLV